VKCARPAGAQRGEGHYRWKPKVRKTCEVCGAERWVKPSLADRFRACSKRCASALAKRAAPRVSSLERTMAGAMAAIGLEPEAQVAFRWYVVDFAFHEARVVVECDGTYWHARPKQQRLDHSKDSYLRNRGWRVVRLTEEAIKADPAACAEHVRAVVTARPPGRARARDDNSREVAQG
jgi:very-short-patch-repair endonuclease